MKKIFFVMISTVIFFTITSCSSKENENVTLKNFSSVYVEIDDDTQKEIEDAYKQKYNNEISWCTPDKNVNSFKDLNELNEYVESNWGFRLYGKFGNSYVICEYAEPSTAAYYSSLNYDDIELLNNVSVFNTSYRQTYIYSDGNFEEFQLVMGKTDLYGNVDISLDEALEIKSNNDAYNRKYFEKFMTSEDEDIFQAYYRIYNELVN